jgi:hypothetical protein
MQVVLKPFASADLNKMEFRSILVSVITIYCGLYYLTPDVTFEGRVILFVCLLVFNTVFFSYWLVFFFKDCAKATWAMIFRILSRRKTNSVVPEDVPDIIHDEIYKDAQEFAPVVNMQTSDKHFDENDEDENEEEEKHESEELQGVSIKIGRKVNALTVMMNNPDQDSVHMLKGTRNTVRYNAFDDSL